MIDPSKYGAETSSDIAAFLLGAFVGGTLDAMVNIAGFAEPLVFAPLCGAGTMGLKKFVFDVPRHGAERATKLEVDRLEFEASELCCCQHP